jgi:hypothetical protein
MAPASCQPAVSDHLGSPDASVTSADPFRGLSWIVAPGIGIARSIERAGESTMVDRSARQSSFETQLEGRASFMRRNLTVSESAFWCRLAGKRLGVAFNRQVPFDRYVLTSRHPLLG